MTVQVRRYPFSTPLCDLSTPLRDRETQRDTAEFSRAFAQLRLRIQHVTGCSDRKAFISYNYVDVEVNPDTLSPQVEGEPTPLQKFDFGIRTAIRHSWNDELFPTADTADAESIGFEEPFYVPAKGADLSEEPEVEEPSLITTLDEDPHDNLSKEEILELLAFWRRITESTRAILCRASISNECAADNLYDALEQLMHEYQQFCASNRTWTLSELQYELACNAEIFRYIAGVLRYVDNFDTHLTPSELLMQRLVFIANRIPLPVMVTDDSITPIAPNGAADPESSSEEADDTPLDPAGEDADPTVPNPRSSTENTGGSDEGPSTT